MYIAIYFENIFQKCLLIWLLPHRKVFKFYRVKYGYISLNGAVYFLFYKFYPQFPKFL